MTTTRITPQRGTDPQDRTDPAASTVRTPVTVPWRLCARTRAWLTDRPHTGTFVRAILDELAELERAGHPPDILTTVGYLLFEHQIRTRTGRCHGCRRRHGTWRRLWRRPFPCEVWYVVHLGLQGFYTRPPLGPGTPSAGRHAARSTL
ncbi:MAG: hypothetical protein WCF33_09800 [Pseudonocardiaceae bacterium]